MAIEITLDLQAIQDLQRIAVQSAKEALEEVITDVKNDIPMNQGALQRSEYVDQQTENGRTHIFIDHNCEYARFIYFGKLMIDPETGSPFAEKGHKKVLTDIDLNLHSGKKEWLQPYIDGDKKDFILTEFANIFKKNTGV